jgi:uncharacterized membrane protein SirB2
MYQWALYIHVGCVIASFALFFVRGIWMMAQPAMLHRHWVRITPHAVDTTLLASAIVLCVVTSQYPFVDAWLTLKIVLLLCYIILGSLALKRGRTRALRIASWTGALAVYALIVSVAVTRLHPAAVL